MVRSRLIKTMVEWNHVQEQLTKIEAVYGRDNKKNSSELLKAKYITGDLPVFPTQAARNKVNSRKQTHYKSIDRDSQWKNPTFSSDLYDLFQQNDRIDYLYKRAQTEEMSRNNRKALMAGPKTARFGDENESDDESVDISFHNSQTEDVLGQTPQRNMKKRNSIQKAKYAEAIDRIQMSLGVGTPVNNMFVTHNTGRRPRMMGSTCTHLSTSLSLCTTKMMKHS